MFTSTKLFFKLMRQDTFSSVLNYFINLSVPCNFQFYQVKDWTLASCICCDGHNSAFAVIVQLICLNLRHCHLTNHITRCFLGTNLFCSGKTTHEYVLVLLIGCKKSKNAQRDTEINTVGFIVHLSTAKYPPLMLWLLFYCEGFL